MVICEEGKHKWVQGKDVKEDSFCEICGMSANAKLDNELPCMYGQKCPSNSYDKCCLYCSDEKGKKCRGICTDENVPCRTQEDYRKKLINILNKIVITEVGIEPDWGCKIPINELDTQWLFNYDKYNHESDIVIPEILAKFILKEKYRINKDMFGQILEEITSAILSLDGDSHLLSIIGSWDDTLEDEEVLEQLKEWNKHQKEKK
jgi:hypothetical protein